LGHQKQEPAPKPINQELDDLIATLKERRESSSPAKHTLVGDVEPYDNPESRESVVSSSGMLQRASGFLNSDLAFHSVTPSSYSILIIR
jgi:hypothetical protein